jgi:hypothetical protein
MDCGVDAEAGVEASGRRFTPDEVRLVVEVVERFPKLSRSELAQTLCELLDWKRASGRLKGREARDLLTALERRALLRLPEKRAGRPPGREAHIPCSAVGDAQPLLAVRLDQVRPVSLHVVRSAAEHALFRELVGRHHYLGFATPFGAHLRYLVRSGGTVLGCLQYSSAAWRLAARDHFVGWSERARRSNLPRVLQQSRFLMLPWVRVPHLASHALALSTRRIGPDWQQKYGVRPLLVETLVDPARFGGTCYRAANWVWLGETSGRGRMDRAHARHGRAPKLLFVYPLARRACAALRRES